MTSFIPEGNVCWWTKMNAQRLLSRDNEIPQLLMLNYKHSHTTAFVINGQFYIFSLKCVRTRVCAPAYSASPNHLCARVRGDPPNDFGLEPNITCCSPSHLDAFPPFSTAGRVIASTSCERRREWPFKALLSIFPPDGTVERPKYTLIPLLRGGTQIDVYGCVPGASHCRNTYWFITICVRNSSLCSSSCVMNL